MEKKKRTSIKDEVMTAILAGKFSTNQLKGFLNGQDNKTTVVKFTLTEKEKRAICDEVLLSEAERKIIMLKDEAFETKIAELKAKHEKHAKTLAAMEKARQAKARKK